MRSVNSEKCVGPFSLRSGYEYYDPGQSTGTHRLFDRHVMRFRVSCSAERGIGAKHHPKIRSGTPMSKMLSMRLRKIASTFAIARKCGFYLSPTGKSTMFTLFSKDRNPISLSWEMSWYVILYFSHSNQVFSYLNWWFKQEKWKIESYNQSLAFWTKACQCSWAFNAQFWWQARIWQLLCNYHRFNESDFSVSEPNCFRSVLHKEGRIRSFGTLNFVDR